MIHNYDFLGDYEHMPISEDYIELKFKTLEENIKEIKANIKELKDNNGKIPVAIISLIGVVFATIGSLAGTIITAIFKANGWF